MSIAISIIVPSQAKPARHRADVALRCTHGVAARGCDFIAPAYAIISCDGTLLNARSYQAFAFEPIQRRINRAGRDLARRSLHDFVANR